MKYSAAFALLALLAFTGIRSAGAHSELATPMYVSADGADDGRCLEIDAPCRSLAYAISNAGKGNQIRVGLGRLEIEDVGVIFHLVSGTLDIRGGYDLERGEASGEKTTLIGVPGEYRAALAERGFHVVADTKGLSTDISRQTSALMKQRAQMQAGLGSAPCQAGSVGGLACDQVDLISHVPLNAVTARPPRGADVWGFVDLNTNREYAFMGYGTGTAVFDISDPANPREVGFVDGQNTIWRDIKVHQTYNAATGRFEAFAYVTTDGIGDGLFVIDLRELPQRISRSAYTSDFSQAHNVFATNADYATGLPVNEGAPGLIIAGSNNGTGIFRRYALDVPDSPFFTSTPNASESVCASDGCYMHDAASMIIDDDRRNQCPNATTYCEVLFDFNESTIDLWDITDPADPIRLSRTPYSNSRYTHSGWPSEDKKTLFVHDELDERNAGLNTTVRAFAIADLAAPVLVGTYTGNNDAIDHNGFVRGNRYYMSNYSNGLSILDITNPASMTRVGFLDTYPAPSAPAFVGAWGAYPYFPSGLIAISDIDSGLYLAEDRTLDVAAGTLSFTAPSHGVAEGGSASLAVSRAGGSVGIATVDVEIVHATTDGNDIAVTSGTLTWSDGDSATKTVEIDALVDGSDEALELAIVRLVAPTGGATLSVPAETQLYVGDNAAASNVEFDLDAIDVAERGFGTAVAVVHRGGSAIGNVSVDYSVSGIEASAGSDFTGPLSGTLTWDDGDATPRWLEFEISDDAAAENTETFTVQLANASGAAVGTKDLLTVSIFDADGANAAPSANAGGARTVSSGAAVTLDGSGSTDPDGDSLSFSWSQTLGPTVSLAGATSAQASFTAPQVTADTLLRFQLQVVDPSGATDTASVAITVTATATQTSGGGGGGGGSPAPLWLLALAAALLSRAAGTKRMNLLAQHDQASLDDSAGLQGP